MSPKMKSSAMGISGLAVLASGQLSLLASEEGKAGLWFG
jgi:hypothetical protein